jgi:hypothetical protein
MAIRDFILLGLSGNSNSLEYFVLTGLESPIIFVPPYIELIIPPDDLSLTVPFEAMEYADIYSTVNLVDQNGNQLVDQSGNELVATVTGAGNVFVLHVPPDDLSVTVPPEV